MKYLILTLLLMVCLFSLASPAQAGGVAVASFQSFALPVGGCNVTNAFLLPQPAVAFVPRVRVRTFAPAVIPVGGAAAAASAGGASAAASVGGGAFIGRGRGVAVARTRVGLFGTRSVARVRNFR